MYFGISAVVSFDLSMVLFGNIEVRTWLTKYFVLKTSQNYYRTMQSNRCVVLTQKNNI